MPPDGNCLFHAVADQIYGDHEYHDVVRNLCLDYMVGNWNIVVSNLAFTY